MSIPFLHLNTPKISSNYLLSTEAHSLIPRKISSIKHKVNPFNFDQRPYSRIRRFHVPVVLADEGSCETAFQVNEDGLYETVPVKGEAVPTLLRGRVIG